VARAKDYAGVNLGPYVGVRATANRDGRTVVWVLRCRLCGREVEAVPSAARRNKSCGCERFGGRRNAAVAEANRAWWENATPAERARRARGL
jgi:hypothetical protein